MTAIRLCVLALFGLLIGCNSGSDSSTTIEVGQPAGVGLISSQGEKIDLPTVASVTVPAGAFSANTEIKIASNATDTSQSDFIETLDFFSLQTVSPRSVQITLGIRSQGFLSE